MKDTRHQVELLLQAVLLDSSILPGLYLVDTTKVSFLV